MRGQTVILKGNRAAAHALVDAAPEGAVLNIREAKRSTDQNAKLWACLSDISRQVLHNGRKYDTDMWKALMMKACSHEVQFIMGLDGNPFPVGFRSSRMTKAQMADLITFIIQYGDAQGVRWSNEAKQ